MSKSRESQVSGATLVVIACLLWTCIYCSTAWAGDSCISCHTDEDMLTEYLGTDEKKKSTMQAGPG